MVLPLLGAIIGAGATIGSGILGANAAQQAADKNWQIDLLNYYAAQQERFDTIQQAKRQEGDTKLGMTDANGNRVHFVEGVGWVTELSDEQNALREGYQQEELDQLGDLKKKRGVLDANLKRQGREDTVASQLLDAFQRVHRTPESQLEGILNETSTKALNKQYDTTLADAMRSAVRSGSSNSGKVAAAIGKERGDSLRDAFLNNRASALQMGDEQYNNERANLANLYNMFASRASAMPDVAYNPRNIEGQTGAQMSAAAQQGAGANAALLNSIAKQGGRLESNIEPNYGWADALSQGGQALAGIFDSSNSDRQRQAAFDQYGRYSGLGSAYKQNSGAWG
jgi:hypothetical protein